MVNPSFIFPMTAGAITGFIGTIILMVLLAGMKILDTGISDVSVKAIAVIGTIVNILFAIRINVGSGANIIFEFLSSLPKITGWIIPYSGGQILIGMGLLYPTAYDIFVVPDMGLLGYIGFIFITGISVLALVSGILIAFSGGE